ncbi:hypothetical protein RJ55_05728 [Drechmeria coniospora]|nr:hypothetical protein RJ55_05728 [Drechmeria coniospora]
MPSKVNRWMMPNTPTPDGVCTWPAPRQNSFYDGRMLRIADEAQAPQSTDDIKLVLEPRFVAFTQFSPFPPAGSTALGVCEAAAPYVAALYVAALTESLSGRPRSRVPFHQLRQPVLRRPRQHPAYHPSLRIFVPFRQGWRTDSPLSGTPHRPVVEHTATSTRSTHSSPLFQDPILHPVQQ